MGDTRFKNGIALGPYNNFFARSDNVFAEADSSPDVTLGCLFFSNNSTNTTITHFDLSLVGPIPGGSSHNNAAGQFEGKEINVMFLDDSTRLVNGGNLRLMGSDGLQGANNTIRLIYHNSAWVEFARSYNATNVINVTSASLNSTAAVGTGQVTIRGRGPNVVLYLAAEATTPIVLNNVIGGEAGAFLTLVANGGSSALVIVNSASNIDGTFVSTSSANAAATQFRLTTSAAITFTKFGNRWLEVRPVSGNSSGQLQ